MNPSTEPVYVHWLEQDIQRTALWSTANAGSPPKRVISADDNISADAAYLSISQGTSIVWRGDFHNGRQLLQALARRIDKKAKHRKNRKDKADDIGAPPAAAAPSAQAAALLFARYRHQQSQRANLLNRLLIELDADYKLDLHRAPDVAAACRTALGPASQTVLLSLRVLQGLIGAHEWRTKGLPVQGLPGPLHVHYGVFSPKRGEYLDLVAQAPLPSMDMAFDIGTGSGVLAAILAHRGVRRIVASDVSPRALACAKENIERLGLENVVTLQNTHLFPDGTSPLIVCNPPWLPARPTTALEGAIYDQDNRMLLGFLNGLGAHLETKGEAWLIMSDLAERLGLRSPGFLRDAIRSAGLEVLGKLDTRPNHAKANDENDALAFARRAEITSLWRLSHSTVSFTSSMNSASK